MVFVRIGLNVEQLLFRAPGGIGRYTARLLSTIPALGEGDTVVPFCARHNPAEISDAYQNAGLHSPEVPSPIPLSLPRPLLYESWHLLGVPHLDKASSQLKTIDLIHAPSLAIPPKGTKPLVVTVHDVAFDLHPDAYPWRGRRFHQIGLRQTAKHADLVITATESAAKEISAHSPSLTERIRVVPNGVDHLQASQDQIAHTNKKFGLGDLPYVLWVGSLEPRKDVGTLLEAFARMSREPNGPPHRLVLVGPTGWLHSDQINQRDVRILGNRLKVLGSVEESDLRALYGGADLFAFPSRHEGFGLPVLEAMVQETPVVCSDIPALVEVAGGAAHLVAPGNLSDWSQALRELLTDPSAREELVLRGTVRAKAFSWVKTIAATRAVYVEALSG